MIDLDSDKSGVVGSSLKVLTLYLNTGISVTLKTNGAIHYLSLSLNSLMSRVILEEMRASSIYPSLDAVGSGETEAALTGLDMA